MSDFEADVIDRLGRIETKLDNDYKALHGNGHPGLIDRVCSIERVLAGNSENASKVDELDRRVAEMAMTMAANAGRRTGVNEFLASALALLSIIGTAVSLFITFNK